MTDSVMFDTLYSDNKSATYVLYVYREPEIIILSIRMLLAHCTSFLIYDYGLIFVSVFSHRNEWNGVVVLGKKHFVDSHTSILSFLVFFFK